MPMTSPLSSGQPSSVVGAAMSDARRYRTEQFSLLTLKSIEDRLAVDPVSGSYARSSDPEEEALIPCSRMSGASSGTHPK